MVGVVVNLDRLPIALNCGQTRALEGFKILATID